MTQTTQQKTCRQYSPEFKEEAVSMVAEQGYTVRKAADALGIRVNLLYRWRQEKRERESRKRGAVVVVSGEQHEVALLRAEIKQLRTDLEILKKASAFFARQMG